MSLDELHVAIQFVQAVWRHVHSRTRATDLCQLDQFVDTQTNDFPWAVTAIEKPFDDSQFLDLIDGVNTLTERIPTRLWKVVAFFPDAQRVFGQTRVPLDCCN